MSGICRPAGRYWVRCYAVRHIEPFDIWHWHHVEPALCRWKINILASRELLSPANASFFKHSHERTNNRDLVLTRCTLLQRPLNGFKGNTTPVSGLFKENQILNQRRLLRSQVKWHRLLMLTWLYKNETINRLWKLRVSTNALKQLLFCF